MLVIDATKNKKDNHNNNNNKLLLGEVINQVYKRNKFAQEILEML